MKCSSCYVDNPPWAAVCSACGDPVVPIRICSLGHILPPNASECPVCPSLWPDVPAFTGPPILRAVIWPGDAGLFSEDGSEKVPYLELRDQEAPLCFWIEGSRRVRVVSEDSAQVSAKMLVRPEGMLICLRPGLSDIPVPQDRMQFREIPRGESIRIGKSSLRLVRFEVPAWVGSD